MSKAKEPKVRCCGRKLRRGARECPRCHRVTKAGLNANLRKAVAAQGGAVAFIGKGAGAAVAYCGQGHPNRPGGNCCVRCSAPMPGVVVPPLSAVTKSAFARQFWAREVGGSPDPGLRELLNSMIYGNGGAA